MITLNEYLDAYSRYPFTVKDSYEGQEKDKETIREYNKDLIEKYPWLEPTNRWSGKKITKCANGEKGFWPGNTDALPEYDYDHTELDDMPKGWRIAFGEQMCEELQSELSKFDYADKYIITQIKEKYGYLHWYDNGTPVGKLSEKPIDTVYSEEFNYRWKIDNPKYDNKHIAYVGQTKKGYQFDIYDIIEPCHVWDIIHKYENISEHICINCGKEAEWVTTGWISPYCNDCKEHLEQDEHFYDNFKRIDDGEVE